MLLAGLTLAASGLAFLSFQQFRQELDTISRSNLPIMSIAAHLSEQAQSIVANAPQLAVADSQFTRTTLMLRIADQILVLDEYIKKLKEKGIAEDRFDTLVQLRGSLFNNLSNLNDIVESKLELDRRTNTTFQNLLGLLADLRRLQVMMGDRVAPTLSARMSELPRNFIAQNALSEFAASFDQEIAQDRLNQAWVSNAEQTITAMFGTFGISLSGALDATRKEIEVRLVDGDRLLTHLTPTILEQALTIQTGLREITLGEDGLIATHSRVLSTQRLIQEALATNKVFADRFDSTAAKVSYDIEADVLKTSADVTELTQRQTWVVTAIAVACIVFSALILFQIRRQVILRLRRLQETMRAFANGARSPIDTTGNDELSDMAEALEFFVTTISEREAALAASESRQRSVTDNLPGAVFRMERDDDGHVALTYISPGVQPLVNISPSRLVSHPAGALALVPESEQVRFQTAIDQSAREKTRFFFECASPKSGPDGQLRWIRFMSFPRPADAGRIVWDGLMLDSTEWKQADLAKRAFVSTVSHELRTPLTSIQGSLGLVAGGAMGVLPEAARRLIDIANSNCQRLTRLINDILDIEKIELGHMDFVLTRQAVAPLLHQAIEANRGFGVPRNVRLSLREPVPEIEVMVDSDRFIQVMTNLISNAVKYSPVGGEVVIAANLGKFGVQIVVIDHGTGIPAAFRPHVFERFTQADSSDRRAKGGTGLGLSIAHAIVERFGGKIGFETEENVGTTFIIDLPTAPVVKKPESPALVICTPDPALAQMLRQCAQGLNLPTLWLSTLSQGLDYVPGHGIRALVLDPALPDGDGYGLLPLLTDPETPVLIMGARRERQGNTRQTWHFCPKPTNVDDLERSITQLLSTTTDAKPAILHVEDDEDLASVVQSLIADRADLVKAHSLEQAERAVYQRHFQLIILDLKLPDGDGQSLIKFLPGSGLNETTPVLIFTAEQPKNAEILEPHALLIKSATDHLALLRKIEGFLTESMHP